MSDRESILYNKSNLKMEIAVKRKCPRCKGVGYTYKDEDESCHLCKGHCEVWLSIENTGWTRPLHGRIGKSEQCW